MTTHTIQTHKLIERLISEGLSAKQSTAIVEGVLEIQQDFATKQDLKVLQSNLELALLNTANKMLMSNAALIGLAVAIIKLF